MTEVTDPASAYAALTDEISRVLVGNEAVVERLAIALLTDGHVLLEGVPGVAKTTIAELFARATGLSYSRIQLTPDSLPADITGSTVYREETGEFEVRKGPVFAHVVVADEINRATPKTQSALLEAMEERRVTIEGETFELPDPFLVVATQNPIEMEGTFELPEAQRDRFQFKLRVDVPDREGEAALLERFDSAPDLGPSDVEQVLHPGHVPGLRRIVDSVHVSEPVRGYQLSLVEALRDHAAVRHGPSPRASLALQRAAKARAALRDRGYVLPEDVKDLAVPGLAHRLVLGTDATLGDVSQESVVEETLAAVEAPSAATVEATSEDPDLDAVAPDVFEWSFESEDGAREG